MKIKDVMTSTAIKYCSPETKLHNAAQIMKDGNCGALPVIDKDKKVVGMITDRDICLSLAKNQTEPLEKRTVDKIMSKKIQTITTTDDISVAFQKMRTNQIGRLPVVDENGKLKGIVSLHNLINASLNDGQEQLGNIAASGENLLKTIQAVTNRYNGNGSVKSKKETTTLKKTKTKAELVDY